MTLEPTTRIVRNSGNLTTNVDQDIIILNMARNNYVALNVIGRRIWELIENPVEVSALCARLGEEFSGDQQQINADVQGFLAKLMDEGLAQIL